MFPGFESYEDFRDGSFHFVAEATPRTPHKKIVRSGAPGRLTLIPSSSSTFHEHADGRSVRAGRRDDDRLATVPIFPAPLCHSNLRIQAAFVVTFPDSDWTIMTQMVSLLIATISTHPNCCQDRPYRTLSWTRCCGFRRCPERRRCETPSDPKSQSAGGKRVCRSRDSRSIPLIPRI
jgi:hypothetical protein